MKWNLMVYQVQPYNIGFPKYFVFARNHCCGHVKWGTWALRSCKAFGDVWVCAPQVNVGVMLMYIVPFIQCCHIPHTSQHHAGICLWAWLNPIQTMMHVVVYSVLSDFYRSTSGVGIIDGGDRRGMSDVALAWHPDNVSCVCCALVPHPACLNRLQDL